MKSLEIERATIAGDGVETPAVWCLPSAPRAGVLLLHGYGGCKEEMLGPAWRLAEVGCAVCTIDLRGHGEHPAPLDMGVVADVEAALAGCRQYGPTVAIGHSLGGRLALSSDADFVVALSPALGHEFSEQTQGMLRELRSYRVREEGMQVLPSLLKTLPDWRPTARPTLLVYGTRDVPEIAAACKEWGAQGVPVREIPCARHGDIFLLETTIELITKRLGTWWIAQRSQHAGG